MSVIPFHNQGHLSLLGHLLGENVMAFIPRAVDHGSIPSRVIQNPLELIASLFGAEGCRETCRITTDVLVSG